MIDSKKLNDKQRKRYHQLLATAEEMIYENGFYKLSLKDITSKLSISRSTIYEYFGSKEGLVEAVVDKLTKRLDDSLEAVLNDTSLGSEAKFIKLAQAQSFNINANCHRLFRDLKIHLPDLYSAFEKGRKERENNGYKKLILCGIEDDLFDKTLAPDVLLQLYLKMGQLTGDTDILEHISMKKGEAMESIIHVFLKGTKKSSDA